MRVLSSIFAILLLAGCAHHPPAQTSKGATRSITHTAKQPERNYSYAHSKFRHYRWHRHAYHTEILPTVRPSEASVPSSHYDEGPLTPPPPVRPSVTTAVAPPIGDPNVCGKYPEACSLSGPGEGNKSTGSKEPGGPLCCANDIGIPTSDPRIKGYVPVYFSTNRKVKIGVPFAVNSITYEPSQEATLGRVLVSVPIIHKLGQTEVPGTTFFGFKEAPDVGKHFMMQSILKMSREEFVAAMANPADSLMLFIHGYNVTFTDAAFKSAQIAFDVHYQGRVLMYSWPSKGGMFDYDYDRESALVSSDALFDLLKLVKNEAKVSKIIVVAHSLGSEVLIGALKQAYDTGMKLGISELVFAASDVSANLYKLRGQQILAAADKVTLYASSTDLALLASLKKSQTDTRMGYVLKSGPTIVKGVETIDVSAVGQDMFGLNHSTYSTSRAVIDDIGRIIISGDHPPDKRIPSLELMPDKTHATYWMYPF